MAKESTLQKRRAAEVRASIRSSGLDRQKIGVWADMNVTRLLNADPSDSSQRVQLIIEVLQKIRALVHGTTQDGKQFLAELGRQMTEINDILQIYRWIPFATWVVDDGWPLAITYEAEATADKGVSENRAVIWILQNLKLVHRFRRCRLPSCGKWFFGMVDSQVYCGKGCLRRDVSQGSQFKQKRAEYMRSYRRQQHEMDLAAKRQLRER